MTEPHSSETPAAAPPPKVSFFEDLIDIFFQPLAVFRRRQYSSAWGPMLFVAVSIGIITFATFNTLEPIFDAEFRRGAAKALAANPNAADAMNKMRGFTEAFARYGIGVAMMLTMFILGTVAWLVGKAFGSKQTYGAALVVAGWSYMPRVIGSVLGAVQGLLMDPARLTGALAISIGPARFMDPDSSNPLLLQLAGRFDLITIWVTVLLAVGLYATGRVSKGRAVGFGITMWVLGALPALQRGYTAM